MSLASSSELNESESCERLRSRVYIVTFMFMFDYPQNVVLEYILLGMLEESQSTPHENQQCLLFGIML